MVDSNAKRGGLLRHLVGQCGVPMILREVREGITNPFSFGGMQKIVQTMRARLGLSSTFTLDACRHGGMTELEEAELTDGQGRALSAHKSQQAYEGYAKRTMERALSATRKRHAHRLTNASGTNIQNGGQNGVQNADRTEQNFLAKSRINLKNWLAGAPGFEPGDGGIKIRCLTTWLRPNAAAGP